jgi:hypothetical protein
MNKIIAPKLRHKPEFGQSLHNFTKLASIGELQKMSQTFTVQGRERRYDPSEMALNERTKL